MHGLYTNPATLLALSNDPTPDNYESRAMKELSAFLEPLAQNIENFYTEVAELKHVYLSGYGKDAAYSTIGPLRNFPETVGQRCTALVYYHRIPMPLRTPIISRQKHGKGINP